MLFGADIRLIPMLNATLDAWARDTTDTGLIGLQTGSIGGPGSLIRGAIPLTGSLPISGNTSCTMLRSFSINRNMLRSSAVKQTLLRRTTL